MSLNNQLCLIRPTIIDLNFVELDYCPFMSRLHKCNGICNAADGLSTEMSSE